MSLPELQPLATPRPESRPNLRPVAPHEQPTRSAETAPETQNQVPTLTPGPVANPVPAVVDQSVEQAGVVERPVVALPTRADATKAVGGLHKTPRGCCESNKRRSGRPKGSNQQHQAGLPNQH